MTSAVRAPRLARLLAVLGVLALAGATGTAPAAASGDSPDGDCRNGYVGLTYDDGPTPETRTALLAALRAVHARATFFEIGQNARAHPDLTRAALRARMWVGNHTYTHPHLPQLPGPTAYQEVASTQFVLRQVTGRSPTLFRPPFGETSDQVRADVADAGLLDVLWTVDSRDWAGAGTDEIVAAAATLRPGGIILMHDWATASLAAVPRIAADLAARGLCTGRIAFTPHDVPGAGTTFHAVAVAP